MPKHTMSMNRSFFIRAAQTYRQILQTATFLTFIIEVFNNSVKLKSGLSPPSPPPLSAKRQSSAHAGDFFQFSIRTKQAEPALTSAAVRKTTKFCSRGRFFATLCIKKQPAQKAQAAGSMNLSYFTSEYTSCRTNPFPFCVCKPIPFERDKNQSLSSKSPV